ncbi:hypothetical protein QBC44DRAFT_95300 [Cladorrhinum sp. PSN332]|nr:hypothetical protein QBC44DRAFT_95300 [Cladorrhinum sp. PSN332]
MAPARNHSPLQRDRGNPAQRGVRGGRVRGKRGARGGRAPGGSFSSPGRAASLAVSDSGDASIPGAATGNSRRYNKMAPAEPIIAQAPAWQVGDGPQKADTHLLRMLETGVHADATVVCRDRVWNVHKMALMSRSGWFAQGIQASDAAAKPEFNLSMEYTPEDVNTILHTIYSNRLPEECYNPLDTKSFNLANFVKLFNIGVLFSVEAMRNDALTLLGQLCDRNLELICSYDRELSNSEGKFPDNKPPKICTDDLCLALHTAFLKSNTYSDLAAQCLLANYIYAARGVLLADSSRSSTITSLSSSPVKQIIDNTPIIKAALWDASQGRNLAGWLPDRKIIVERHNQFDHTRKTQHPDRCEMCDETFDGAHRKRVMYDPHKIVIRPVAYCLTCVEKADGEPQTIFRKQGKTDREGQGMAAEGYARKIKKEPLDDMDLLPVGPQIQEGQDESPDLGA